MEHLFTNNTCSSVNMNGQLTMSKPTGSVTRNNSDGLNTVQVKNKPVTGQRLLQLK